MDQQNQPSPGQELRQTPRRDHRDAEVVRHAQAILAAVGAADGDDDLYLPPSICMTTLQLPAVPPADRERRTHVEKIRDAVPGLRTRWIGNVLCIYAADWHRILRRIRELAAGAEDWTFAIERFLDEQRPRPAGIRQGRAVTKLRG